MLEFNFHFRFSAKQLLDLPAFAEIREEEFEVEAPFKIELEVDSEGSYDYTRYRSDTTTLNDLKGMVREEIKLLSQQDKLDI
mmetsp:Transcript_5094/g.8684  ORF Transcript_5094/g.8684 Transcript_5094/m.8684 type:complete len:82 (+) Transcript_5094:1336-1581(+)